MAEAPLPVITSPARDAVTEAQTGAPKQEELLLAVLRLGVRARGASRFGVWRESWFVDRCLFSWVLTGQKREGSCPFYKGTYLMTCHLPDVTPPNTSHRGLVFICGFRWGGQVVDGRVFMHLPSSLADGCRGPAPFGDPRPSHKLPTPFRVQAVLHIWGLGLEVIQRLRFGAEEGALAQLALSPCCSRAGPGGPGGGGSALRRPASPAWTGQFPLTLAGSAGHVH